MLKLPSTKYENSQFESKFTSYFWGNLMTKFQIRRVEYPEFLYIAVLWMKQEGRKDIPLVLPYIYYPELKLINKIKKDLSKPNTNKVIVKNYFAIVKLKYKKEIPLKKEFWNAPEMTREDKQLENNILFLMAINNKSKYSIVVTPMGKDSGGVEGFSLAHAFKKVTVKALEKFMKSSDLYVDPTATTAAIYRVMDMYGYDFRTGQKIKNGKGYWEN